MAVGHRLMWSVNEHFDMASGHWCTAPSAWTVTQLTCSGTTAGWHAEQCAGCGACCGSLLRPIDCSAVCTFSLLAFFDGLGIGSSMEVKWCHWRKSRDNGRLLTADPGWNSIWHASLSACQDTAKGRLSCITSAIFLTLYMVACCYHSWFMFMHLQHIHGEDTYKKIKLDLKDKWHSQHKTVWTCTPRPPPPDRIRVWTTCICAFYCAFCRICEPDFLAQNFQLTISQCCSNCIYTSGAKISTWAAIGYQNFEA